MKKEDLILAMANAPAKTDVEVAVKDSNEANTLYREVIRVEHRHEEKTGKEYISLICFKSLKEQQQYDKKLLGKAKRAKKQQEAKEQAPQDKPTPQGRPTPDVKTALTGRDLPQMVKEQLAKLETAQQGNSPDNFSQ